jgi:hypothetical protein
VIADSGCFDLSTAEFNYDPGDEANPYGEYVGGNLQGTVAHGLISVRFPDYPLTEFDRTKTYEFTVTFAAESGTDEDFAVLAHPTNDAASWASGDGSYIGGENGDGSAVNVVAVGVDAPFYSDWAGVDVGWEGISFEGQGADTIITSICWGVVGDAPTTSGAQPRRIFQRSL